MAALIEERVTWVQYDARGFGLSDRGATDFSLGAWLLDLEAVIEALDAPKFALLAGGAAAAVALAYTERNPERVLALHHPNGLASGKELGPGWNALVELARSDWNVAIKTFAYAYTFNATAETAAELYDIMRQTCTQSAFLDLFMAIGTWDAWPSVRHVKCPALVTWSGPENIVPLEGTRRLATSLANSEFTIVGENATERMPLVEAFLARVTGQSTARSSSDKYAIRTVLFTDLVGHTEMMQRLGDEKGRDVLREHERITREVLKTHGGREVKTMGDGFMASFGSVTGAVECAIALQKAFDVHNRGVGLGAASSAPTEPLSVRVGLNAGEPIEEDGDLFGSTVILASRIAAAAEGGEVLASMAVRELCSGKGFLFADRGEQAMRGFEDPVRVFEVSWRT